MPHYPDQAECDAFGSSCAAQLRAAGWLAHSAPFSTGETSRAVFDRLVAWSRDPWQPLLLAGAHSCDLCQFDGAIGSKVLFIPDREFAWVCPELITHYINAHRYRPPDAFCQAVLAAPEMRTSDYLKALRNCAPDLVRLAAGANEA